jgi:hypothetical protein
MKPESGCSGTAATPCLSEHAGKEAAYETKITRNASHGLAQAAQPSCAYTAWRFLMQKRDSPSLV